MTNIKIHRRKPQYLMDRIDRNGRLLYSYSSQSTGHQDARHDEMDFDQDEMRNDHRGSARRYKRHTVKHATMETANTGYEWAVSYWREGLDWNPSYRGGTFDVTGEDGAWSSAFISYAFRKSQAGFQFPYSQRHSEYIYHAMNNRLRLIDALSQEGKTLEDYLDGSVELPIEFRNQPLTRRERREYKKGHHEDRDPVSANYPLVAFQLDDGYVPREGDIVCYSRESKPPKWEDPRRRYESHGDIVVSRRDSVLEVIGGNVGQSVAKKIVRLREGRLPRSGRKWFAVVANLIR